MFVHGTGKEGEENLSGESGNGSFQQGEFAGFKIYAP